MVAAARFDRLSDEALLEAMGLGDPNAAAAFVRRFQRRVHGLALTITSDPTSAEDVAQQAFERAWRAAAAYDPRRGSVVTWLLVITRNLAIDSVRVRRPGPIDPVLLSDLLAPSTEPDPQHRAEVAVQLERVHGLLERIPDEQRRAVVLATVAGRTAAEVAEIERIPLGTAKTRIRAGLRRLRAATSEELR